MMFSDKEIAAFDFEIKEAKLESQGIKTEATHAYITLTGGSIRFRVDGGEPNSTQGHILCDRQSIEIKNRRNVEHFKFIQSGTIPGSLTITYGRP